MNILAFDDKLRETKVKSIFNLSKEATRTISVSNEKLKNVEELRGQLTSENRKLREDNEVLSDHLQKLTQSNEDLKRENESGNLRETALRSELNSVRERNGALENSKLEMSKKSDSMHATVLDRVAKSRKMVDHTMVDYISYTLTRGPIRSNWLKFHRFPYWGNHKCHFLYLPPLNVFSGLKQRLFSYRKFSTGWKSLVLNGWF